MKWIPIDKARKLIFNLPVFTQSKDGIFGIGKLVKKEQTDKGVVHSFAVTYYDGTNPEPVYFTCTDITHVAIP